MIKAVQSELKETKRDKLACPLIPSITQVHTLSPLVFKIKPKFSENENTAYLCILMRHGRIINVGQINQEKKSL